MVEMFTIASASLVVEVRTLTVTVHLRRVANTAAFISFRRRNEVRGWVLAIILILIANTVATLIIVGFWLVALFLTSCFVTDTLASFFITDTS